MTQASWTTAPGTDWPQDEIEIVAGDHSVAVVWGPDREANARLFTAAPAMLKSLRALVEPYDGLSEEDMRQYSSTRKEADDILAALAARAAIAAATGEGA